MNGGGVFFLPYSAAAENDKANDEHKDGCQDVSCRFAVEHSLVFGGRAGLVKETLLFFLVLSLAAVSRWLHAVNQVGWCILISSGEIIFGFKVAHLQKEERKQGLIRGHGSNPRQGWIFN